MRRFLSIALALCVGLTLSLDVNAAKRMGGGKSFGSSYRTAPAPSKSTADAPAQRQQADAARPAQQGARKSGLMGGLLGGLLMGGLFAALFAGGAFEGLQPMDIVIIAALAFIGFKVMRSLRRGSAAARSTAPAYAGGGQQSGKQQFKSKFHPRALCRGV